MDTKKKLLNIKVIIPVALIIVLAVFTFFVGKNSYYSLHKNEKYIETLKTEVHKARTEHEKNVETIRMIDSDPATVERVAREQHGMKREGETVYSYDEPDANATQ